MSEVKVNKISPRTNCGTVTVGDSGDSVSVTAGVPVTVNGDLKSNALKATDGGSIISQSGTTITLGASGDTINLASGASQSGFGRTGTVNWVTTVKTTGFTAVSGEGYFCNTSGGAFTLTLPASPSAGDIVGLKDYNGNFATANLTIGRNSQPINGGTAADAVIKTAGASIFLVYVDATQGWVATQDDSSTFAGESFVVATGGTITTCGDDKIHTFTGPGTFTVCSAASGSENNLVSYMVVAGGGGSVNDRGGAGGAGGFREVKSPVTPYTASPLDGYPSSPNRITVTATSFPITVGAGGTGDSSPPFTVGGNGADSVFSSITSTGGGGGGRTPVAGANGGSGGGGGCAAGSGNTPPVSPSQGNGGGTGTPNSPPVGNGGGGGATAAGSPAPGPAVGGVGGAGATTSINATATAFAGGGGGGSDNECGPGAGGVGGGGDGAAGYPGAATGGTANTGGGAGGASGGGVGGVAKNGGSGIVIIRYKFQ